MSSDSHEPTSPASDHHAYDRWAAFCASRQAWITVALWALAEAIYWPVIPDAVLVPLTLTRGRQTWQPLLATIIGSSVGAGALFLWARARPDQASRYAQHLPLVSSAQRARVRLHLEQHGAQGFLNQPASGVGVRVWVLEAAALGIPAGPALTTGIIARSVRMAAVAATSALLGKACEIPMRRHARALGAAYALATLAANWWVQRAR
jgi:membrane protein YqaA with SNARE-associated domain